MKIVKKGSIDILQIDEHSSSSIGIFRIIRIYHSIEPKYCVIGGTGKIKIHISENKNGSNPTIIATNDRWKYYNKGDAISALVDIGYIHTDVAFFNANFLKTCWNKNEKVNVNV